MGGIKKTMKEIEHRDAIQTAINMLYDALKNAACEDFISMESYAILVVTIEVLAKNINRDLQQQQQHQQQKAQP
jgi:hypothetical protein